jgi:hypothetical protein
MSDDSRRIPCACAESAISNLCGSRRAGCTGGYCSLGRNWAPTGEEERIHAGRGDCRAVW